MRVLVTGASGQLGYDVVKRLEKLSIECIGVSSRDFDITDLEAAEKYIKNYLPDVIIHCAAYTFVDKAEEEEDKCRIINVRGTENIAKVCKKITAKMVYISTDYVFPGTGEQFYEVDDEKGPCNVYGRTKLEGEFAVQRILEKYFIVRISWVFGSNGNNFVKTMLKLAKEKREINVVNDQIGSPTYTVDLAVLLCEMIQSEKYGVYHATNEGICSWADFAKEIFRQKRLDTMVKDISSSAYITKAVRPLNSRMSKRKLDTADFKRLPQWQDALTRYINEFNK